MLGVSWSCTPSTPQCGSTKASGGALIPLRIEGTANLPRTGATRPIDDHPSHCNCQIFLTPNDRPAMKSSRPSYLKATPLRCLDARGSSSSPAGAPAPQPCADPMIGQQVLSAASLSHCSPNPFVGGTQPLWFHAKPSIPVCRFKISQDGHSSFFCSLVKCHIAKHC